MYVLEVVKFKLKEGVNKQVFLDAAAKTQAVAKAMQGFIERALGVSKDDIWIDTVKWKDMESALKAFEEFPKTPEGMELMGMIDMENAEMNHFEMEDLA